MPHRPTIALPALLLLLLAPVAIAQDLLGRVVGISDGDTLTLLTERREEVRVRLSDIDTLERGQPRGTRARQALSDLAFGKAVRIVVRDTYRYGRTVGRVHAGAQDVNAEMARRGASWVFRRYSDDPALLRLEQAARAERLGLWALPRPSASRPGSGGRQGASAERTRGPSPRPLRHLLVLLQPQALQADRGVDLVETRCALGQAHRGGLKRMRTATNSNICGKGIPTLQVKRLP